MTDPIRVRFATESREIDPGRSGIVRATPVGIDITPAIADQILGLTDLPARIAALEQKLPCHTHAGLPDAVEVAQPAGDDAAVHLIAGILSAYGVNTAAPPDFCLAPARAVLAAVRRGEVPGIVTQQWADYQLVGATCKKYEDEIVALRAKLADVVEQRAIAQRVIIQTADERDAARADADALAWLLKGYCSNAPPGLQERIDAALAKHGGGE